MRTIALTLASLSLGALAACGSDEPASADEAEATTALAAAAPAEEATAAPSAVAIEPAHGGTIVRAGDHAIEVVPHASGEVYAYVHSELPRPAEVEMTVQVPVEGGDPRPVQLRWDRRERRFEGVARGVVLVPGPIAIDVVIGEVHLHEEVVIVALAPAIHVDVHIDEHHHDHHHHHHHRHKHHKHRKHRKHRHHHRH